MFFFKFCYLLLFSYFLIIRASVGLANISVIDDDNNHDCDNDNDDEYDDHDND